MSNPTDYNVTEIGMTLMAGGTFVRAKAASLYKFFKSETLKCHFQHSQVDSYVKKVPNIDCYFLLEILKQNL